MPFQAPWVPALNGHVTFQAFTWIIVSKWQMRLLLLLIKVCYVMKMHLLHFLYNFLFLLFFTLLLHTNPNFNLCYQGWPEAKLNRGPSLGPGRIDLLPPKRDRSDRTRNKIISVDRYTVAYTQRRPNKHSRLFTKPYVADENRFFFP